MEPTLEEIANTPGAGSTGIGVNTGTGIVLTPEQQAEMQYNMDANNWYNDLYQGKGGHISKADVEKVQKQILSQGLTSKWKGQGFGSAEANALDMAKSLVASGVTDIKQIGQGMSYRPQAVTTQMVDSNGQKVQERDGKYFVVVPDSSNPDGAVLQEVDPKTLTKQIGYQEEVSDENGSYSYFKPLTAEEQKKVKTDANGNMTIPVAAGEGIINKDTGERLLSNYNERTQGNAFGGTYAGSGNTAYRVQFDAQGNPIFYTTQHSSNDLANMLQDNALLNVVANVAAAYFGGPAGSAALAAAQGKDIGDIAKAYVLSDLGNTAGAYIGGSEALVDVLGKTGAQVAGNAAKSYVTSEGKIDPVAALLAGGVDAGVGAVIGNIPGFESLDKGTQAAVTKAVSTTLRTGKLSPADLAQAAFKAGTSAMANATNTPTEAQFNAANEDFLKTLEPYLSGDAASKQDHLIKVLTDAGLTPEEVANTDWAALYAQPTTDPVTGKTIVGGDPSQFANQDIKIDPTQLASYNQNLQKIIDKGGFTSQWQTSSGDRIMVSDDGSGIGINQDGNPYALTKEQVDKMVQNGQLNTKDSGYVDATGGTGTTPGGTAKPTTPVTGTKPTTPATGTQPTTPTTPGSSTTTGAPTVTRFGLDPLEVLKMGIPLAKINPLEELFGGSIYDYTPASSAHKDTTSETDPVKVLEESQNTQEFSSGGDIHALLQLLRS